MGAVTWFMQLMLFAWLYVIVVVIGAASVSCLKKGDDFPEGAFVAFAALSLYWILPEIPRWHGMLGIVFALLGYAYAVVATKDADAFTTFVGIALSLSLVVTWLPAAFAFVAIWAFDAAKAYYGFRLPAIHPFGIESEAE